MKSKGDILLQKWIAGSITLAEERELERLAQEDAVLADALAGLRSLPAVNHAQHTQHIQERLRARTRRQRGLLFYLPRIAVAAAIVLLAVRLVWPVLTESAATSEEMVIVAPAPEMPLQDDMAEVIADDSVPTRSAAPSTARTAPPPATNADVMADAPTQPERYEPPATEDAERTSEIAENPPQELTARQAARPPAAPAPVLSPPQVSGRITDAQGNPLIGATVMVKGTTIGTISNLDGNFSLRLPEGAKTLVVNYTGFTSQEVATEASSFVKVQLSEAGTVLEDVVVTGSARKKQQTQPPVQYPVPMEGFRQLERYIRQNLQYPPEARAQQIEGNVTLRFRIQSDGTPTDFAVIQSLGYGCDAEAMRLLREGPKWLVPDSTQTVATYTIVFRLKK